MTGAANTEAPTRMEIGLVLQGGGALGAYEWGAITALFDVIDEAIHNGQDITLRVVTGVSIGAINAACVVGAADRADARNRLSAMWSDFMIDLPYLPPSANRDPLQRAAFLHVSLRPLSRADLDLPLRHASIAADIVGPRRF